ncbi:MAG: tetratricopeptide repeat protein [Anaerolineaceae bacterium]|nr:tetratricopeptide repeat protein [Anaerolineaceae bacterium]
MKKRILISILLFSLLVSACTLPGQTGTLAPSGSGQVPLVASSMTPSPTVTPTPSPAGRINSGDNSLLLGDYDTAAREFQTAITLSDDMETKSRAQLELGRIDYMRENWEPCQTIFRDLIDKYPDSTSVPAAYFLLGDCYNGSEKFSDAAAAFNEYIQRTPNLIHGYVQRMRGDALYASGDFQNAIQAYQAAIDSEYYADTSYIQIKVGQCYANLADYNNAIRNYMAAYDATNNNYAKAQANLLAGQSYITMGVPEQAYARFQDSVNNFPETFDAYSALVALVNDNQPVNEYFRGLVDYKAGQYSVAVEAFDRFITSTPDHDARAHYYKTLSLRALDQPQAALVEIDALIRDHAGDPLWATAWDEKADILWYDLENYPQAADVLLTYVAKFPDAPDSPNFLFTAGRIQEIGGQLTNAAATWARLIDEYPSAERGYLALFLSGITYYRLENFDQAKLTFQRNLVLAVSPEERASARFWIGKTLLAKNDPAGAKQAWEQAYQEDPTGYYSERARELLNNEPILNPNINFDLGYDLEAEKPEAEAWLRKTFNLAPDMNLAGPGDLSGDMRFQRGNAFWDLSQYTPARAEFETLRSDISTDPVKTYRLLNHLMDLGNYRPAILAARQILDLANLDDVSTLQAPKFFNHIRFGVYFREVLLPAATDSGIHPFVLLSLIRQESMFDAQIMSSANAMGLMQLLPVVGEEQATGLGWPVGFTTKDLLRPFVNVKLGTRFFQQQLNYFGGDLYATLAAYNGGPGNAILWKSLASNDPDLFLESIRYEETRRYIRQIVEFANIYRLIYQRSN